ncbi:MAG: FAD-dependent oxidoreductase [Eggerthellaceae bacterium]
MELTRRTFLKGALASGALAAGAGALAGCSPVETAPSGASSDGAGGQGVAQEAVWSWELPEDPITDVAEEKSYDVVVVGCGMSGMCAAISAAERGANVVVLEKTGQRNVRGMHIAGVDTSAQREAGIVIDKYKSARDIVRWDGKRLKEELLWLFMNHSGRAVDWCFDICKEHYPEMYLTMWDACYKGEDYYENPGVTHIFSGGPKSANFGFNEDIADCLMAKGEELGIEYVYNTPGVQLVKDGDYTVTGVIAGEEGSYTKYTGNVILATGDYGSNEEMVKAYLPWHSACMPTSTRQRTGIPETATSWG